MLNLDTVCRRIGVWALLVALGACSDGGINTPAREFSGVWLYEFEGSTFVEGAATIPAARPLREETDWLEWVDQPLIEGLMDTEPSDLVEHCHPVQAIRLRFIGYRTHFPVGGAGHFGLWRSKVTIQRTLSAERLGPAFLLRALDP